MIIILKKQLIRTIIKKNLIKNKGEVYILKFIILKFIIKKNNKQQQQTCTI
jgi:hypothetical protein